MGLIRYCLVWLCIYLFSPGLSAQLYQEEIEQGKDKFQLFGFQGTYNANQDQKLTNQVYSGYGGGIHAGEMAYHNDRFKKFQFAGGYEVLRSPNDYNSNQGWGSLEYKYLFLLGRPGGSQFYLGPFVETLAQFRRASHLSNNATSWDISGGIGPSLHWNHDLKNFFSLDRWRLYSNIDVQLFSYMARPHYALPSLPSDYGFSFIGETVRYTWEFGIQLPASRVNENRYRVFYSWDFVHHRDNEVQSFTSARHFIGFTYLFNTHNSLAHVEE